VSFIRGLHAQGAAAGVKVVVIGCGLIGVTTAYFLRRHGHEVTVIERQEGPGRETSLANGSLLTPSMAEPWNSPGSWRVLLASLARSDSPLQLRLRALPGLTEWGVRFLLNSRRAAFRRNTLANLRLALHSMEVMRALRAETGIEYGHAAVGTLRVFRDRAAMDRAVAASGRLIEAGLNYEVLEKRALVEREPALAPIADELAGGIHYPADESGNAYRFCVALAEHARKAGVEFRFRTGVTALETRASRVSAAMIGTERVVADAYVVAAGSYGAPLLKRLGLDLPVRPAKGYSITIEGLRQTPALRIPVVDDDLHAVVVPLEGAIRVAGTAEFAGFDLTLQEARIRNLVNLVQRVLPREHVDPANAKPWCGLRPMSADGVPIIGPTPLSNLHVNTGHGHLGWTMAAGSGELLARLMSGEAAAIDPAPYALQRFG
jgi:D-amino-acid dehydrogenase